VEFECISLKPWKQSIAQLKAFVWKVNQSNS